MEYDIGMRWLEKGRTDLAVERFARATQLERGMSPPRTESQRSVRAGLYYNYGIALRTLHRDDEALPWFERAARAAPQGRPQIAALMEAYAKRGDLLRADSLRARLEKVVGGAGLLAELAGRRAALEGHLAEAESLFRVAVRLDPGLADGWTALLRVEVEQGKIAEARRSLERAKQAGLSGPSLEIHEALVLALEGHSDGARRRLAKVDESALGGDERLRDVMNVVRGLLSRPQ
jgi:tetratricopeptide (TPR) repeat protein